MAAYERVLWYPACSLLWLSIMQPCNSTHTIAKTKIWSFDCIALIVLKWPFYCLHSYKEKHTQSYNNIDYGILILYINSNKMISVVKTLHDEILMLCVPQNEILIHNIPLFPILCSC